MSDNKDKNGWCSKDIESWLKDIKNGIVKLPRFQRGEVWNAKQVEKFLEVVVIEQALKGHVLPLGVMLVLEVDSTNQPFKTRALPNTADIPNKCREHLLDGQQRLTALWKAMKDKHDKCYFISFERNNGKYELKDIKGEKRANWVGKAEEEYKRKYIPFKLFSSLENGGIESWLQNIDIENEAKLNLARVVGNLRKSIAKIEFPYFRLPQETDPDSAIKVFIGTNTAGTKLTPYDIAVAQFEQENKESLLELVGDISDAVPGIAKLEGQEDVGDLVLKIACLDQDKKPTYGNYRELNMPELNEKKEMFLNGIKWAVEVLAEQKIWTAQQLPTTVPLRVLPVIHQYMPSKGDNLAHARGLITKYLWRSFCTDRYERQANDRLKQDYEVLRSAIENESYQPEPKTQNGNSTVFDEEKFQLPSVPALLNQGWPKSKGILKRAVLATCNQKDARDIADDGKLSKDNIASREYHHIFPKKLLRTKAPEENPDVALNWMLIEEYTNQTVSAKWPGDYLLERVWHATRGSLSEEQAKNKVKSRLESHLIPGDFLINVSSNGPLKNQYKEFLKKRAEMIAEKMRELCRESND